MRKAVISTFALGTLAATSLLAGSSTQVQAQGLSTNDLAVFLPTASYARMGEPMRHRMVQHRRAYHPGNAGGVEVNSTGSVLAAPCLTGTPRCTAAGYPNLHYDREIQGSY